MLTLKVAITQAVAELPLKMLQKAIDGWYTRVALCVQAGGMQFKHRLKCEGELFICAQDEYENELTMCTADEH